MHRLFLQFYLTALAVLLLFGALAAAVFLSTGGSFREREMLDGLAVVAAEALPPRDAPPEELEQALEGLGAAFGADLTVFDSGHGRLASAGRPLAPPPADVDRSRWLVWRRGGPTVALRLADGRWLLARHPHRFDGRGLLHLGLLALACGVGAYPLVRRQTRRLERLERQAEALGAGDLSARVEVEGRDEVARLARRFNSAAERIERLVEAQRHLLAAASHELRSPLARLRMAIEALPAAGPEARERLEREIRILDGLIEELLLASRLEAGDGLEEREEVELLALAAEEAALHDVEVGGAEASVVGDPRLLRRLVRNLLENARRYGGPEVRVELTVGPDGDGGALLVVEDDGPGVPPAQRERIFEPFTRLPGHAERDGGVGLGLALVRRIARRHGGDVECLESAAGGGARFEVRLGARPS